MKSKKGARAATILLRRKLFLRMFAAGLLVGGGCVAVYTLLRGRFAQSFVDFLEEHFFLKWQDSHTIYQFVFRNNLDKILLAFSVLACVLIFCAAFRAVAGYITRVFGAVADSVASLTGEAGQAEALPHELAFLQDRLNRCRAAFEDRERDARLAEQRKNDLVVYLAHDIRTPLTSVIGYLSLLDEVPDMPAPQRAKYVKVTLDKAYRLEKLTDDLFEITRYNSQSVQLEETWVDLHYMLLQMAEEFYPQLTRQGKRAEVRADESLQAYADPDQLARVFNNILKNAVAYSAPGSTVGISAVRCGRSVAVTFRNTGKAIPKHQLDMVFERFYRLDNARSSNAGGSGLGLAIAKEIVLLHGGTITAESENGVTAFTVTLPDPPEGRAW